MRPRPRSKASSNRRDLPRSRRQRSATTRRAPITWRLLERPGRATSKVIAEIVPEIVRSFPWPKSMRWGSGRLRWVRPLHSILCLFDGKVVDFAIDGIRSSKETRGHRFMAPEPFKVEDFADYTNKLREAKVILDGEERARLIAEQARSLAKRHGLTLVEDEALIAENAGLAEWPVALMGSFDEDFLSVPQEVLTTSMKAHQKCFSLRRSLTSPPEGEVGGSPRAAKRREVVQPNLPDFEPPSLGGGDLTFEPLANKFILIANIKAEDRGEAITAGNERVIAAPQHRRQVLLRPGPQGDARGTRAQAEGDRLPR